MTVEKEATEEKTFSVCASTDKRKKVYNHGSIEICIGEIKESIEWSALRIRVGLLMLSPKMYVYDISKNRLEIYFEFS